MKDLKEWKRVDQFELIPQLLQGIHHVVQRVPGPDKKPVQFVVELRHQEIHIHEPLLISNSLKHLQMENAFPWIQMLVI